MNRILGAVHIVIAVVVAVYFMFGGLLDSPWDHQFWAVLDWAMAVACVLSLYYAYTWKRNLDEGASTKDFITHKMLFLGAATLALWFFPSWIAEWMGEGSEVSRALGEQFWMFIDPLFVLTVGCVGMRLWSEG